MLTATVHERCSLVTTSLISCTEGCAVTKVSYGRPYSSPGLESERGGGQRGTMTHTYVIMGKAKKHG